MKDVTKDDQWKEWMEEFKSESDRACAVLGPAVLDSQLYHLLKDYFVNDPTKTEKLFEGPAGPAANFSSRINLAYALGFISPDELYDLNIIRKIRNKFAHELHGLTFSIQHISDLCRKLKYPDKAALSDMVLNDRDRFVLTVVLLANWIALRRLGIRDSRRIVQKEVQFV